MDNRQLKKRSRQGAVISLFGFLIVILVFLFAANRLKNLNSEIESKTMEIESKISEIDALDSTMHVLKSDIESSQKLVKELIEEINKLRDPTIQPNVNAVEIPGLFDSKNRQIYDFTVWITSSKHTLDKITKVTYKFGHDTFMLKTRESIDSSNGFLVSYRGWGCLAAVKVIVDYEEGESEEFYFSMCEKLSW